MTRIPLTDIWPDHAPLIGMVHLGPLPGSPAWAGNMTKVLDQARRDADALVAAGFDGLMVENYSDVPFFRGLVPAETIAAMTACTLAVAETAGVPVGVNVLRNDALGALGVATATGARFVRVNVHTGAMWTDQGLIEGDAAHTLRRRRELGSSAAIFADVHVKHATPPHGESITAAASDGWHRGRSDALVVSGVGTGAVTDPDHLRAVRAALPGAPLLVGSGASPENAEALLTLSAGLIVGSSVNDKRDGSRREPPRSRPGIRRGQSPCIAARFAATASYGFRSK